MFKTGRERFRFIEDNCCGRAAQASFPLKKMCRVLEVSRSGYYAFKARPKSRNRINNEKLLIEIRGVFWDNNRNYGSPRIWNQLRDKENMPCSRNRIARLMRYNGIAAVHKRRFRATTNSRHNYPVWPNVLNRNFAVEKLNTVWVLDITYIWTREGWLCLAAIMDLFSRGIVGLAMDKTIAATLALLALKQAILRRNPLKGLSVIPTGAFNMPATILKPYWLSMSLSAA